MAKLSHFIALCAVMATAGGGRALAQAAVNIPPMALTSRAFADGGVIPDRYTLASTTPVSPALDWENVPAGVVSFALIMHDPDSITDKSSSDFLHWIVFNIPSSVHGLPEALPGVASLADGTTQANNRRGVPGYMGPGARNVYHHYTIELYALDTQLKLGPDTTRPELLAAMDGHVIAKGVLIGRFHR
jgi:Raf kinase inhibitor-like YbhB/YbcL family protein